MMKTLEVAGRLSWTTGLVRFKGGSVSWEGNREMPMVWVEGVGEGAVVDVI